MPSLVPPFHGNIGFNAQHSPAGAFTSFTCGHSGTGGGIGVEIGKPGTQDLFIGVKQGGRASSAPLMCLPFLRGVGGPSAAANYDVEKAAAAAAQNRSYATYSAEQIARNYGWATDRWTTPDFSFTIFTPFDEIPEPGADHHAMRNAVRPAIIAALEVDNRRGTQPKTAVFAIDFGEAGTRLLNHDGDRDAIAPQELGFAWRRKMGVLGTLDGRKPDELSALQRWSVAEGLTDINTIHALGNTAGLVFEVPAGEKRTLTLAIGVYLDGVVTTGLEGQYFYTRYFANLEAVLSDALHDAARQCEIAHKLDDELLGSGLSADQQFMIAHATRSYYGSTQLLDVGGEPFWVVNEGEYCMMNTLDLTVDQVFWELKHNPWVVRNQLDNFTRHYAYHDQVKSRGGTQMPGGISFAHDMGVNNNFAPSGRSSYELANLNGCFSYMTQEELCNWILTSVCYVAKTGDTDWLVRNRHVLTACAESMRARAGRDGITAFDSMYCGIGQEITTYDSLDESLGQTRANTYIAVKCWACWVGLELLNSMLPNGAETPIATGKSLAARLSAALIERVDANGVLAAVLEIDNPGFHSRILPVAEALVYPSYWLDCLTAAGTDNEAAMDLLRRSLADPLVDLLRRHTLHLLNDPARSNLFADGGIKLSSTSNNSWMSKIVLFQHVCRTVLRLKDVDPKIEALFAKADAAHTKWQTDGISGFWACSDQFINGEAKGSRYYPRIVTAALALDEAAMLGRRTAEHGRLASTL